MTPAAALAARFAKATSVLLSMCCELHCQKVYGVPRRVEPKFAGVSHGLCPKHYNATMAALGLLGKGA